MARSLATPSDNGGTSRSAGPAYLSVSIPRLSGANARRSEPTVRDWSEALPVRRPWFGPTGDGAPEIREEMKKIAAKRRRFGYRQVGVMLERDGSAMNHS